jgi:putative hemolysin
VNDELLTLVPLLLPLPIPLAAVAFFSGAETALFSLTYHDRLRLAKEHPAAGRMVNALLARPRGLLILILFLNMVAGTLYFVLTSLALLRAPEPWLAITLGAANLLLMTVVGEVVSKMLAARYRVTISRLIAAPLVVVYRVCRPIIELVEAGVIAPLARLFVPPVSADGGGRIRQNLTSEELDALLHLGAQEGAIDADEQRVLGQVIRLSALRVRDVMTPRVDVQWLDTSATAPDVIALARQHALTRIPIARPGESIDESVVGLLDVKRFLAAHAAGKPLTLESCVEPVAYTPESASLDKLLHHLRTAGSKLSVCVSEHGTVTGVITLQDVVKRLVTELARDDEQQLAAAQVRVTGEGTWTVPGRLSVREWASMFGLKADRRVTTVAGLIFARLGRTPQLGDTVTFGNVRLRVSELDGRVVETATVDLVATPSSPATGEVPRG